MSTKKKNEQEKNKNCAIKERQCSTLEPPDTQIFHPTFARLSQQFLGYFADMSAGQLKLLFGVLSLAKDGSVIGPNKLFIAKRQREWLSEVTGLKDSTVKEDLSDFVWGGLMLRDERGVYRLNPYLFSTVSIKETWKLCSLYVFRPKMRTAMMEAAYQKKKAADTEKGDSSLDCTQGRTDYAQRPLESTWFPKYHRALEIADFMRQRDADEIPLEYENLLEPEYDDEDDVTERKSFASDSYAQEASDKKRFKDAFFQVYLPSIDVFTKLTSATLFIFLELLKDMQWNNSGQMIYITASIRKKIIKKRTAFLKRQAMCARELSTDSNGQHASSGHEIKDCHRGTFTKALAALCKADLLRKIGEGQYQLNPLHFGFSKRLSLMGLRSVSKGKPVDKPDNKKKENKNDE